MEHGGRDVQVYKSNEERTQANAMYQTTRWARLRAKYLSSQPLCQSCLKRGIVTPATDIDHVFPWRPLGKDAFYANYYQCQYLPGFQRDRFRGNTGAGESLFQLLPCGF